MSNDETLMYALATEDDGLVHWVLSFGEPDAKRALDRCADYVALCGAEIDTVANIDSESTIVLGIFKAPCTSCEKIADEMASSPSQLNVLEGANAQ